MVVLIRAITYASLFIGFVLVFLPARLLRWSGIPGPPAIGPAQFIGAAVVVLGGALAIWCVLTFAIVGRGTPAPFDPPRHLVVRGPYRFVRNPMYIGAGFALLGATAYYESLALLGFTGLFFLATHVFVVGYEEPTLRGLFGAEYDEYRRQVRRWWPTRPAESRRRDM